MSEAKRIASFAIEDMKEGSSLWDNVRAVLVAGKFTKEPPDNYTAEGNPIFAHVEFLVAGDAPEEERRHTQDYSLGGTAGDNFTISDDGDYLIPVDDNAAPRKDSKFGLFAQSLQANGVSKTVMAAFQFSKLVGLDGHWNRKDDPERNFSDDQRQRNPKKSKFKPSTLVLTKLYALPGEKAAGKSNGATVSAAPVSAPVATDAVTGDLDTDTANYLVAAVAKTKDKRAQRAQLIMLVSRAAINDQRRLQIAQRSQDEAFLKSLVELGLITYDPADKHQFIGLAAGA